MYKKLLSLSIVTSLVTVLFISNVAYAETPAEKWVPYLGESNIYVNTSYERFTHQKVYWRAKTASVFFDDIYDTYEHQTVFYDYDDDAFARDASGYYDSNFPDPYLDTQALNNWGFAGSPDEPDISVGSYDPNEFAESTWYYYIAKLKNTSTTNSMYKITAQEGTNYGCGKNCVYGNTSAVLIPFKSQFKAPVNDQDYKYEWESNNNMTIASSDLTNVGDWGTGTISSTSDVDYWDMNISSGRYYKFILRVPQVTGVDYDLIIYNDSGTQVAKLNAGEKVDEVNDVWLGAGHYYMKIYSYKGSAVYTQYHLIATPV
jgi:hypothetical protein